MTFGCSVGKGGSLREWLAENILMFEGSSVQTNDLGYFEISLPYSSSFSDSNQKFTINVSKSGTEISTTSSSKQLTFTVPDQALADIRDLLS